jgi:hypothetical protein
VIDRFLIDSIAEGFRVHEHCTRELMPRFLVFGPVVCLVVACGSSPSEPSETNTSRVLLGQAVNAIDGAAASGASVQVNALWPTTADGNGMFSIDVGSPGIHRVVIRAGTFVERETAVSGPSADRVRLSLIPNSFDMTAYDEMFRTTNGRLQRWITPPALVVLGSVMTYRNGGGDEYEATAEQLSDDEVSQMIAHLTEGLALLTGETYTSFASVTVERPAPGARVAVKRGARIVVGRYNGIVTLVNTIGYGQWEELPDGTVVGGSMFLDRDFDRDDSRRRRLRIHELGHALGYLHVKTRTSIMNPSIGPEPTDFDRTAARIAFQRPPGNHAPDVDPTSPVRTSSVNGDSGARWMPPVICQ